MGQAKVQLGRPKVQLDQPKVLWVYAPKGRMLEQMLLLAPRYRPEMSKKGIRKILHLCKIFLEPLHYRQIHYISGYEKSNFKSWIIGNLYVKILACLEKDPSWVRKSLELCFLRPDLNFFLEFLKFFWFTISLILKITIL